MMARPPVRYTLESFNISRSLIAHYKEVTKGKRLSYTHYKNAKSAMIKHKACLQIMHNINEANKVKVRTLKVKNVIIVLTHLYTFHEMTAMELSKVLKLSLRATQELLQGMVVLSQTYNLYGHTITMQSRLELRRYVCPFSDSDIPY